MKFREITDNDLDKLLVFTRKNCVNSFLVDKSFLHFWFRREDGSWTIQAAFRDDETISAINTMIESPGKIANKSSTITWMSTAISESDAQELGVGGRMLFYAHRSAPLIACTCANENSLPINKALCVDVNGLKLRRFICVLLDDCLKITKKESQCKVKRIIYKKPENIGRYTSKWVKHIPDEFTDIWTDFSKDFSCTVNRDVDYMKHRYITSPYCDYDILTINSPIGKLCGLAVIRLQDTSHGKCARIVDFVSISGCDIDVWRCILLSCLEKKCLFVDFFIMGTSQDKNLLESGFMLETDSNFLKGIPNLLSPIDYRSWTYTFHIGGYLLKELGTEWCDGKKVWFTKGDGDRDWPTPVSCN